MVDNPHYVTPEDAKRKSCPMAKPNTAFHDPRCNGPNCMAWRWVYQWAEITDDWETERKKPAYSTTHGYCGILRP